MCLSAFDMQSSMMRNLLDWARSGRREVSVELLEAFDSSDIYILLELSRASASSQYFWGSMMCRANCESSLEAILWTTRRASHQHCRT